MLTAFRQLFPFHGRLSRRGFLIAFVVTAILANLAASLVILIATASVDFLVSEQFDWKGETATGLVLLGGLYIYFWIMASLYIRRAHDLGWSGKMCFWLLMPVVNLWIMFKLAATPGEPAANCYGAPVLA